MNRLDEAMPAAPTDEPRRPRPMPTPPLPGRADSC
jgi:hypothetical protein